MEQRFNLHSLSSERVSTTLVIVSGGWALDRLGHAFFRSRTFENWLELDDPKDEAMLISLLDRLFTIAVIVAIAAGLMVTFGISTSRCHSAGRRRNWHWLQHPTDLPELPDRIHSISTVLLRKAIGSAQMACKEP